MSSWLNYYDNIFMDMKLKTHRHPDKNWLCPGKVFCNRNQKKGQEELWHEHSICEPLSTNQRKFWTLPMSLRMFMFLLMVSNIHTFPNLYFIYLFLCLFMCERLHLSVCAHVHPCTSEAGASVRLFGFSLYLWDSEHWGGCCKFWQSSLMSKNL